MKGKYIITALITLFFSNFFVFAQTNSFKIGLGKVSDPIIHSGSSTNTDTLVNHPKDLPGYGAYDPSKFHLAPKNTALSMAHGYLTFLIISNIENDLKKAGNDQNTTSAILNSLGPDSYMAQAIQESLLLPIPQSGWFQIDENPINIYNNVKNSCPTYAEYFKCLLSANRAEVIDGDHFYSSAVLKGYFDAASYLINNQNNRFAKWGYNYAANKANTETITIGSKKYTFNASQGIMRLIAVLYNRGAWYVPVSTLLNTDGKTSIYNLRGDFTDPNVPSIHFRTPFVYTDGQNAWQYGSRYANQIPEIVNQLDCAAKFYNESISADDIKKYLDELSINNGHDKLFNQTVINAGKNETDVVMGSKSYAFNSPEFYQAFYKIVNTMIQKTESNVQFM